MHAQKLLGILPALAISALISSVPTARAQAMTLSEVLTRSLDHSSELKASFAELVKAQAEIGAIDAAFDSTVYASYSKTKDESEQSSAFAGKSREKNEAKLGYRKFFSTGTALDVNYTQGDSKTTFPPPIRDANGTIVSDPSSAVSPNPAYAAKMGMTIKQPLWRNFMAKEVSLAEAAAQIKMVSANESYKIQKQMVQSKSEALYWTLLAMNANITNMNRLVAKAKEFARLMQKRANLGRADDVDVATAEANVVDREGGLLNLEIARDQIAWQLAFAIGMPSIEALTALKGTPLESNLAKLPAANQKAAFDYALTNRRDLKMRQGMLEAIGSSLALADEIGKAKVDLFASYNGNGLDAKAAAANSEAYGFENPTLAYGIEFSMSLGNTKSHMDRKAAAASRLNLEEQVNQAKFEINRDLALAYAKLEGAARQVAQAARQKRSLERKEKEEQRKLKQARTDRVGVLRYQMEVLAAETGRIEALRSRHDANREIRTILHAYPSGS